jgi:hypothetical protein
MADPANDYAAAVNEIRNLLHRYCELQDTGDMEATTELFRYSSYIVPGVASHYGYDEVLKAKSGNKKYDDGTLKTKHVTTNSIIEVDVAAGTATARSYFTVFQATPDLPLQPIIAGRYHDRFERVDGKWRYCERVIYGDLRGNMSSHIPQNPLDAAPSH